VAGRLPLPRLPTQAQLLRLQAMQEPLQARHGVPQLQLPVLQPLLVLLSHLRRPPSPGSSRHCWEGLQLPQASLLNSS
jgi:hypothetical protein